MTPDEAARKALYDARMQVLSTTDNEVHQHLLGLAINRLARAAWEAGGHSAAAASGVRSTVTEPSWLLPKETT